MSRTHSRGSTPPNLGRQEEVQQLALLYASISLILTKHQMKSLCNCQLWRIEGILERHLDYGQKIKAMQMQGWDKAKLGTLMDILIFRSLKSIRNINKRPCTCSPYDTPTKSDYDYMLKDLDTDDMKEYLEAVGYKE